MTSDANSSARALRALSWTTLGLLLIFPAAGTALGQGPGPDVLERPAIHESGPNIASPSSFVENAGQLRNEQVRFYTDSGSPRIAFGRGTVLLMLLEYSGRDPSVHDRTGFVPDAASPSRGVLVRLTFDGANPAEPRGSGEMPHRNHFFLGSDPAAWRTNVRSYREVVYEELYDDIDLRYRATPGGVKYEFVVRPGGDPSRIRVVYEGVDRIEVRGDTLVAHTTIGSITDGSLRAFEGDLEVPCAFVPEGPRALRFACEGWSGRAPLVVDPLLYSTYLGATTDDATFSIATRAGNAYVMGVTDSVNFPTTPGAFDPSANGDKDAFVAGLNPAGTALVFATYLGGTLLDWGYGIALDPAGNVFVSGMTESADFPVTAGAYDTTYNGGSPWGGDAFVAKLTPAGDALVYATYVGGRVEENGWTLAVDGSGSAYVAGLTSSSNFPTTPAAYDTTHNGCHDTYVAKLSPNGSALVFSTFLGGTGCYDWPDALQVDGSGAAYVSGFTASPDFPVTAGAYDTTYNGNEDDYVAKLSPDGTTLVFSTFLGGTSYEERAHLAVDGGGAVFVSGFTASADFPVTAGAYDPTFNGDRDVFVAKLDATGASLVYSTFIGGTLSEHGEGIAVDAAGQAHAIGYTDSSDFPVTPGAYDVSYNGLGDVFVSVLDENGTTLLYSTFLGGSQGDVGWAITVDVADIYLTGWTQSSDFPTTPGALDSSFGGQPRDSFLAKLRTASGGNRPPVANAGAGQSVFKRMFVGLDGTGSYDPDGDPLTFSWQQVAGPPVTLAGPTTATPSFTPTEAGAYGFELTVRDPGGASAADLANVTVVNRPPVARAGVDGSAAKNATVILDGSASADPDGDALVFVWDQTSGPVPIGIANADQAVASFVPPASGAYGFQLLVIDVDGAASWDFVNISVTNSVPVASAGPDRLARKLAPVVLDGSASYDPDGDPLAYSWTQVEGPPVILQGAGTASPGFMPPLGVRYRFVLSVVDSEGARSQDDVNVTAWGLPPVANLHASPIATLVGTPVRFNGSASADPDGTIVGFSFDFGDGNQASGTEALAVHAYAVAGTYVATLTVTDIDGNTSADSVTIAVRQNIAPVPSLSVVPGASGTLATVFSFDASGSSDSDGVIVGYAWDFGDGTTAVGWRVVHGFDRRGLLEVTLTVTDDAGASGTATVSVEIRNRAPELLAAMPPESAVVIVGDVKSLAVDARDLDWDALTYLWSLDGGTVGGNGSVYGFRSDRAGVYTIRVVVSDGFEAVAHEWTVTVRERPANVSVLAAGVVAAIAVLAVVIWLLLRRRRAGEGGK